MAIFDFDSAIVRSPGRSVVRGLRAGDQQDPSHAVVDAEHARYVAALEAAGLTVEVLPSLEAFPDSMFVEDPALVFTEGAILLRPVAPSRRGEVRQLRPTLERRFERVLALGEGFADGGDVLVAPTGVYIGLSARTDAAGARSLIAALDALGYRGRIVSTPPGTLHLKTASSLVDEETVLVTAALAASGMFTGLRTLVTPDDEPGAANVLRVNGVVLAAEHYPRTLDLLRGHGLQVVALPVSEVAKIDAGLSCMSLRWRADAP